MANTKKSSAEIMGRALRLTREQGLITGQPKLVVAVSGGPDSVCLLHILVKLRENLGLGLHVAHLDHQLRGTESEADAQYVADLTRQLDIPATIERRDVRAYQAQHRLSPEEAAREVRYNFLAQVAHTAGTDRVAVGHTVDDHIETILMHLIRGTGTRGMRGLRPSSRWQSPGNSLTIIRPLLTVSREETANYCRQHRLKPRLDLSNLSLSPLRNRIRQQLRPLLQNYNPRVAAALLRAARIAVEDYAFLDKEVTRLWDEIAREQGDTVILDKAKFLRLPPALQRHLLRAAIEKRLGDLKDIETRHIEGILSSLNKPAGKKISLPEGLIFTIEYDDFLLGADPAALSPYPSLTAESALKIPGRTELTGWRVTATMIVRKQMKETDNGLIACFDLAKTGCKLTVRSRRPGDRFQPLGLSQSKKLNEFMIDRKIPNAWRQRVPIVCSPEHILWVVGWRIDERVKIAAETEKVLRLEFKRTQPPL
ncbi:MAG: tRNA lysidine(34) synthetase TilS [Dehalococcoidales bacterium]|jgi:tRNA(Ile)-lysidine synthase|nr:tRNA lysidine(34) synthetase TilS [Dehalococcoidales bacterium]MDP7286027.1 tRNA lysidine(34) synthetase TilS [Dehalococcoidales bacterium]MDP7415973.1 tRNA lysidine(34) synthetase TilS [Dehalococcoidales bacterium]